MGVCAAYVILDLETTGLDPHKDRILEIGAIAIDDKLNEEARFLGVAHYDPSNVEWSHVDDVVQKMHAENGLWRECAEADTDEERLDWSLADWLTAVAAPKVILMSDAVHFDLSFLRARMPLTALRLNYRVVDLESIQWWLKIFGYTVPEKKPCPHRGLFDCEIKLEYARELRDLVAVAVLGGVPQAIEDAGKR